MPAAPESPAAPGWTDRLLAAYRRTGWRGFTRLHHALKSWGGRREILTASRYGTCFFLNPYHSVDFHVMHEGFYESEVLEAVRPELALPGTVLWVVGANFGLHAVTAKFLHPGARVIAFEPNPAMTTLLLEHSRLNGVELEVHSYALAAHEGLAEFHVNSTGNPGMSTLHPVEPADYDQRFQVAVTTPRAVIAAGLAPAPHVLLVDAEGAEAEILAGFGDLLHAPSLRCLVFEAPENFLERREPAALHALVHDRGFELAALARREKTGNGLANFVGRRPRAR